MSLGARRLIPILILVALAGGVLLWLRTPGEVVRATGTVVPATERAITSPVDAQVTGVHARVGDQVQAGDPILSLDIADAEQLADRIERDLAIKNSQQIQAQLALQGTLTDVDARIDRTTIELRSLNIALANTRRRVEEGLASDEQLEASLLAVQDAEFDLGRLQEERWRLTQAEVAAVDTLAAERRMLQLEAMDNRQRLDSGTVRADRPGRLTWLTGDPGALVRRGDVVARITDPETSRIYADVPGDASWIEPGARALVRIAIDGVELRGTVSDITPITPSGHRRITVALDDSSHPWLEAGLEVEVVVSR